MLDLKKVVIAGTIISSALVLSGCKLTGSSNVSSGPTSTQPVGEETIKQAAVVTFNNGQFSPAKLSVKKGEKIIVRNESQVKIQFNSDPHPAHNLYPELNLGVIEAGQLKTLVITREGTYTYHNHLNASQRGQLVIE